MSLSSSLPPLFDNSHFSLVLESLELVHSPRALAANQSTGNKQSAIDINVDGDIQTIPTNNRLSNVTNGSQNCSQCVTKKSFMTKKPTATTKERGKG